MKVKMLQNHQRLSRMNHVTQKQVLSYYNLRLVSDRRQTWHFQNFTHGVVTRPMVDFGKSFHPPPQLKADRPHPRDHLHTPTNYRHTDKHHRLVMNLIAPCCMSISSTVRGQTNGQRERQTDRETDRQMDATKCIISLASWSKKIWKTFGRMQVYWNSMFVFIV